MRRSTHLMIAVAISVACLWPAGTFAQPLPRSVSIMTRNMDEGTGFLYLVAATSPLEFLDAVTRTYQEVQASNPSARAAAVAAEIAAANPKPMLVGLQEASLWRTGSPGSADATIVQIDQLDSLLTALKAQGLHYAPLAVQPNLDVEAPSSLGYNVRITDRNVVLVRTDLPPSQLKVVQVMAQPYSSANTLVVNSAVGPVPIPRSWIAVDAQVRGTAFRFITTHLEATSPTLQVGQGNELLQGPANTTMPEVIAGDLNTAASGGPDQTATYANLLAAGFGDAWALANPGDLGFTWALHGEDPFPGLPSPTLSERIDLVLIRNHVGVTGVQRVDYQAPAPSGLWPSDHAGITAQLLLDT
jgi:endonuclease/exonuclease/phosphatase family metal-dependent hydrolase